MNKAGNNITPNKFAKELILDKMDELLEGYWVEALETYDFDTGKQGWDGMTQKELDEVKRLLRKRVKGVYSYLGYTREGL
jgi:hypothetical protein|tara:strand:- start:239 stop:478 length:240 start_codon:yes stop_codon:yes gene_type:complete